MTYKSANANNNANITLLFAKPNFPDKEPIEVDDTLTDFESLITQIVPIRNVILSKYSYVLWCCQILKGLKLANLNQICKYVLPQDLIGIYSENPVFRPLRVLVPATFTLPNQTNASRDNETMINTLRNNADSKVGSSPFLAIVAGSKPSAQSFGFCTGMFSHVFNVTLNKNDIQQIKEMSCRLVLRLGWCTTGFYVPKVAKNRKTQYLFRALVGESLPRCLSIRVDGRNIDLPQPEFHGGFATKLGKRLKMSIDITPPIQSLGLPKVLNVTISWLNAPLEDYGEPILNSVYSGDCPPSLVNVLNLPLYQLTMDHMRSSDEIIDEFKISKEVGPICYLKQEIISMFDPAPIFGLYDFCIPVKHLITIRDAKLHIASRLCSSNDTMMGINDIETEDFLPLSLKCPITSLQIKIPVRGFNCEHLNCFCLNSYIHTNAKRPRWTCPICSNPLPFRNLRKDLFVEHILNDPPMANECEIRVDKELRYWKKTETRPEFTVFTQEKYPELAGLDCSIKRKSNAQEMEVDENPTKPKATTDSSLIILSDSDDEAEEDKNQAASSPPKAQQASISSGISTVPKFIPIEVNTSMNSTINTTEKTIENESNSNPKNSTLEANKNFDTNKLNDIHSKLQTNSIDSCNIFSSGNTANESNPFDRTVPKDVPQNDKLINKFIRNLNTGLAPSKPAQECIDLTADSDEEPETNHQSTPSFSSILEKARCPQNIKNTIPPLIIRKVNSNLEEIKKRFSENHLTNEPSTDKELSTRPKRKVANSAVIYRDASKELDMSEDSENESLSSKIERKTKKYNLLTDSDSSNADSLPSLNKKKRR